MAIIKSTDLDFDTIKGSLKEYLKKTDEFKDYNFEASGISNILDVLAHNTHMNGLIANFALNEAFLSSAQLRSSVVSHAQTLGYTSRSKTGSQANISLQIFTNLLTPSFVTLPAYTEFSSSVDGISYTFMTTEDYIGSNNGAGTYTFATSSGDTSIPIKEGIRKTKTFLVGEVLENQVYVIPDESIDTSTLSVKLYESPSSSVFLNYSNLDDAVRIDEFSRVYKISESPNGYYELSFGDGILLGDQPKAGTKLLVEYLSVKGSPANGANVFVATDTFNINQVEYELVPTTVTFASGGAEREGINSIKFNAPLAFAAQQRLITADDYRALILERYSNDVDDVVAWGGNDNIPADYGKVFVSLNFKDNVLSNTQDLIKGAIKTTLSENLAIMSIDTEFVDPQTTFLEITTIFNFDPDLSGDTIQTTESLIKDTINSYVNTNLSTFNAVFRRSNVLSIVDDLSPAILNSRMEVRIQQRFLPNVNVIKDYTLAFPVTIANPDDDEYTILSSRFVYLGQDCLIQNELESNKLRIVNIANEVVLDNIGEFNPDTGVVYIRGFQPTSITGDIMKISVLPANQSTIRPLRNYIITVDEGASFATGIIDYQNTSVTLT